MIVYHGTGDYSLESLVREGPKLYPRPYLGGKKAFSTTTDFEIATLFALRRSPPAILKGDERGAGVVIEYEIEEGCKGRGWRPAICPGVLQDEKEIAILKTAALDLLAVWYLKVGEWVRRPACEPLKIYVP
jgi:hypothetical protein